MSTIGRIQDSITYLVYDSDIGFGISSTGLKTKLGLTDEQAKVISDEFEDLIWHWYQIAEAHARHYDAEKAAKASVDEFSAPIESGMERTTAEPYPQYEPNDGHGVALDWRFQ